MILFLGNSITEGYGLAPRLAFPERVAERLAEVRAARGEPPLPCVNGGRAGDTSGAALRRLPGYLREASDGRRITHLVIELGINDVLQGLPDSMILQSLREIVRLAREHNPDVRVFLFRIPELPGNPMDWNAERARALSPESCLPAIAQMAAEDPEITLLPFLLEGILFEPELNQPDGIHPNPAGQDRLVENVWAALRDLI